MSAKDPKELSHLLSMLDDPSPVVRKAIADTLIAYGDALPATLVDLPTPPDEVQIRQIRSILGDHNRAWLRKTWPAWLDEPTDAAKLEGALSRLAEFLAGRTHPVSLDSLLDTLASEYSRSRSEDPDPRSLAAFLFEELKLSGDEWNYEHPDNSNLVHVIEKKRGIPISLACVYILVGHRLGLDISGCNLPGHFLARVREDEVEYFVDCFNGGRVLMKDSILEANPSGAATIRAILENPISAETIVIRVLNNLARAFEGRKETADRDLMIALSHVVESHERGEADTEEAGGDAGGFSVGDLVKHRRYGYRGVVVARDEHCRAEESWYQANVTRPDRDQPWYSVLVDGSQQVTYAAESSLVPDDSGRPVDHPLVSKFFDAFLDGTYRRNDRPWPGWQEEA